MDRMVSALAALRCGLDRLATGDVGALDGHRRVAVICNHTSVDRHGQHVVHVLRELPGVEVVRVLAPEHGPWGTHQDMEAVDAEAGGGALDPVLGVEVVSLYGRDAASLAPRREVLRGIDAVIYDVQDIGCRFYTYAATLALAMEVCGEARVPVYVLDRPNPIGGLREGPLLRPGFESFCGLEAGVPIRHGLGAGELARWFRARRAPGCELIVVPGDVGAPHPGWVPPSPNMPTLDTAFVYPGMCLLEGTTLSEGRGTTTPFLLFGAPDVDPIALCETLHGYGLPGVRFVPRRFRPEFQKHAGSICGGAYIVVEDGAAVRSVALGVRVLQALRQVAPVGAFGWRRDAYEFVEDIPAIDLLWGSPELRETLDAGPDSWDRIESMLAASAAEATGWSPDA